MIWRISSGVRRRLTELLAAGRVAAGEHEQHRGSEVGGDTGVVARLRGAADVGVVGAEDDDRVALRLDALVALDDPRGAASPSACVLVRDADAVVVREPRVGVAQQHLEHVVGLGGGACDRTEDAHPLHLTAEQVEDAEGDRGLAGMTFGGRDVDALNHRRKPTRGLGRGWAGAPGWESVQPRRTVEEARGDARRNEEDPRAPARARLPLLRFRPGELAWMAPRGEPGDSLTRSRGPADARGQRRRSVSGSVLQVAITVAPGGFA